MVYWHFVALFLAIPVAALGYLVRRWINREFVLYLVVLVAIAMVFTVPMDNYAINEGIWWFNPELNWGISFFKIPLEEYFFYVLWIAGTALLALGCWHWFGLDRPEEDGENGL